PTKKQVALGDKVATKLLAAIEAAKATTFARLVYGLGIRNVGEHLARVLERAFAGEMERFIGAGREELEALHEVGPIVAEGIVRFMGDDSNTAIIRELLEAGVRPAPVAEEVDAPQPLAGQTFVFSGALEGLTRQEAEERVTRLGGRAASSVSKQTTYLVAGPGAGAKRAKAEELGVEVISEEEFLKLL
ncbi:MAG: helix-hairpin-helix domain-containing protein, partial [Candidatus Neomarinimicrobiota bacterium]